MKYRCTVCGHIYDEEREGVKFADLPDTWTDLRRTEIQVCSCC